MSATYILLLVCGAAAGGFLNGLAGFGTALFALGFWLQVMTPIEAVSLVVFMSVVSGVAGVWMVRDTVLEYRLRLARFAVPAIFGIPIGIASLAYINAGMLKLIIAAFLILYGGFFTIRKNLPKLTRPTRVIDAVIGFVGGALGGAAGLSGALPTMWCAMRPWPKEQTRALIQPYNTIVLSVSAALFAWQGIYDTDGLIRIAIAFPVTMIFTKLGMFIFQRLRDDQFRRLLIGLMLLAGLILSIRELV